ncbi:nucleoside diphosphate kinase regulator [Syntrophotalea acetylenica]|jgi:regulator of nucleoside diphosphate kinase|uniref:Transcription elongation factor GreAB n=1 Tax=Syntrophotalea acetylenica TaxID=29542 RepID=A0A1L3GF08_SYNAC|nr:nucleoside diphosphate kinase regulator [Syntrophotalea acetylenica]APG24532.1 transcription elongation factor GreAB [Syntrophotalea acetylenica]APG45118.1 transcription elongation factor GreAB [Syntrophotalea acetylenica]MDY0263160.1 nucleoside diphosphate kinase regulator [Syntrophotalea acetylenica]
MKKRMIYITETDYEKLEELIDGMKRSGVRDRDDLNSLEEELDKCKIVDQREVPSNVVTLNSRIRFRDLDTGQETITTLVFPNKANFSEGRISVTSQIGTALLGYTVGDVIEWKVRAGNKTIRIEEIIYQPEAAGDYHL